MSFIFEGMNISASGQIFCGLMMGYVLLCISESLSHNHFLHGSKKIRNIWKKTGLLGNYVLNSWYSHHVVHHYRTFKTNHITQFNSKAEENDLSLDLSAMGKRQIVKNSYGLRVGSPKEWIKYFYPHIPHYLALCLLGGGWFSLGACFPMFFYGWLAHFVHPYLHMSYEKALMTASPSMKFFLRTPYFKYLAQHHYLHHRYVNCNFNLMLGGDFFWRSHRIANQADIEHMQELGIYTKPNQLSRQKDLSF
jgi:hypothetical protein